jgi:hypothetical protein
MKLPRIGIAAAGVGCLAALLLRAAFLVSRGETWDLESWRIVVSILRQGKDLYLETSRYNYSPLWAGVLYGLDGLSRALGVSLSLLLPLFLLAVDLGTAALVREIALRKGKSGLQAFFLALLFFANPVSVIVSSRLYTFDNLSIAFLLLAVLSLDRPRSRPAAAVGWLSLSLLAKHVTWFHPLLFARRRREPRLSWPAALFPYAVFLLSLALFWKQWPGIRDHVFRYRSLQETFGTAVLRSVSWLPRETATIVFVLAALAGVYFVRIELDRACLLLFLVVLIFTPGICAYYFVWPVALGALFPSAGYLIYTVVITAFFLKSPDVLGLDWTHLPGWWGCWWATVFWLLWEIRSLARRSSPPFPSPATIQP